MKLQYAVLILLTGCASLHAPEHFAPGTSPSPAQTWTPPPAVAATQQPRKSEAPVLPSGYTPGMAITLAQVVDVALTNNPDTRIAWLEARRAEAAVGSARAAYFPTADLTASINRSHQATQGGATIFNSTTYGPSLSLNYLLFDFGGREAAVEEARQTLIAADFSHNAAIQNVVLRTEEAYYSYLNAKALLAAQDSTLKERKASLDAANARHNAGVATIADVLQEKTALSQAQLTYETIDGNLHAIEGALATAMGLPATTRFDFGELPLDIPTTQVAAAVDELLTKAQTARPELAAARAQADRAKARVQEVRAQGLPAISLSSTISHTHFSGATSNAATPYSAGIALRFPLFTGWRNTYDIKQAELDRQIAEQDVVSLQQQIDLQVWTSYYSLQTATQRLATSRDLLASAQQSQDVALNRYKAGVGTILDVLTAEAALESARAQEVQARADWFVAVAQLAHDTGTLGVEGK